MKVNSIYYHSKFKRHIKNIDASLKESVIRRIDIFRDNCFDPRLKTHKLHGVMQGYYSFSVTHSHRIVFEIIENGVVGFIAFGDHSIYQ